MGHNRRSIKNVSLVLGSVDLVLYLMQWDESLAGWPAKATLGPRDPSAMLFN